MGRGTKLFRAALLTLAGNRAANALAAKYGLRFGARRFIAGLTLDEALERTRELNEQGVAVTLDHLGESIARLEEASKYVDAYLALLEGISESGTRASVSLKPTQMGLRLDEERCFANVREIAGTAGRLGLSVTLDMEDSSCADATIGIARRLRAEGLRNVGTVLQAYLYRSMADLETLTREGVELRLVKGAYKESRRIAYPRLADVDDNFARMIRSRLDSGVYTAIATHDEKIVARTIEYAAKRGVPRDRFEFQMLYGVRAAMQERLAKEGYTVRCYVPYGRMWYPYFVRRLAERPANLLFIVKNAFRR